MHSIYKYISKRYTCTSTHQQVLPTSSSNISSTCI